MKKIALYTLSGAIFLYLIFGVLVAIPSNISHYSTADYIVLIVVYAALLLLALKLLKSAKVAPRPPAPLGKTQYNGEQRNVVIREDRMSKRARDAKMQVEKLEKQREEASEISSLIPIQNPEGILLKAGEECYFQEPVNLVIIKNQVVGRTGGSGGVSVRVAKGLTLHSGSSGSRTIRRDVPYYYPGVLSVTSHRMILSGEKGFDFPLSKMTSLTPMEGLAGYIVQFGRSSYQLITDNPFLLPRILDLMNASGKL